MGREGETRSERVGDRGKGGWGGRGSVEAYKGGSIPVHIQQSMLPGMLHVYVYVYVFYSYLLTKNTKNAFSIPSFPS